MRIPRSLTHAASPFCALLLLVLSVTGASAQKGEITFTTKSPEALKLLIEGLDKLENVEGAAAAPIFERAIKADPDFAIAYLFRAQSGGGFQIFRQNLAKAVELSAKASPGEREWILFAQAQADNNSAQAKTHLDKLLTLFPNDKRVHQLAGNYYRGQGDDQMGAQAFRKATEIDKNYAAAYNQLGYALSDQGNYKEAEKAFQDYIKLRSNSPNPYDSYAELLLKTGRYDESIAQYKKALEKDPAFVASLAGIGNNYIFKRDYEKARQSYQEQFDRAPNVNQKIGAMNLMVSAYVHEGKTAEAVQAAERLAKFAAEQKQIQAGIGAHSTAAFILAEAGKFDEAAKHVAEADRLRDDPSLPERARENQRVGKMSNHAMMLITQGKFDEAKVQIEDLNKLLATRNNPLEQRGLNELLGMLALKQGDHAKALEHFAKADPNDPYVWYYTAQAYEGKGDKQNAKMLYRKIADWNQNDTGYAIVRPRAVAKLGEGPATALDQTRDAKLDQSKPTGEQVAASGSAEQELIKLDKDWGEAGLRGDATVLEGILADDFLGVSATGAATKAQTIAEAKTNAPNLTNATYVASEYTVRFLDPNTAVMTHSALEKGLDKGREYTDQHRSMHVWVKRNGRWQVVASQATPVPQKSTP
ncbi:MAG: tetratricopeptide repeat protein [Acidobacteriota bacterium]|nr:tetratricopeptide repeat protein [Acidobacteriota bacterium]